LSKISVEVTKPPAAQDAHAYSLNRKVTKNARKPVIDSQRNFCPQSHAAGVCFPQFQPDGGPYAGTAPRRGLGAGGNLNLHFGQLRRLFRGRGRKYRSWRRGKSLPRVLEHLELDYRMTSKTISLTEPIRGHQGMIKTIMLREPRYEDFIDLGMPTTWVSLSDGGFSQETPSILGQWIERLADIDPNFLSRLCLRDTLALRGGVLSFFIEAMLPLPMEDGNQFSNSEQSSPSSLNATSGPSTI
jgi:hypothetical protein